MSGAPNEEVPADVRAAAHDWIARMHGPDAEEFEEAFRAWLAADPVHAEVFRDLQLHWDRAKFLTHTETGRARDLASVAVWHRRPAMRWAAVAAVALFLLAAGAVIIRIQPRPGAAPMIALATRTGEVRTVALADGSHVTLDAETRMQVTISPALREVRLLDGSARFDVKPDAARSFAVLTSRGSVTSNGGLFDVTRTNDLVRVTSLKGTLTFKSRSENPGLGSPASFAVAPGQRLSLVGPLPGRVASAPPTPATDWTGGMLSFDGERLADAVAEMNRHNVRKIVLAEASLGELRITGAFHANDGGGFGRAVAAMLGLERRERPDGTVELSRKK